MILSRPRTRPLVALAGSGCLVLAVAGGADASGPATGSGPAGEGYVVATTSIWADLTQQVLCDDSLEVRTLIPAGGDAHSYEPSFQDRETLDGATLIVANGLGLEELLDDTLDQVDDDGTPVFEAGDHVDTIDPDDEHDDGGDHERDDDEDDHEGDDPHIWLDPVRVAGILPALGDALVAAGVDRDVTDDCVAAAVADLRALDQEIATIVETVPAADRQLVTNHDAMRYFGDRYDVEILGTVLPSTSTMTEANPGQLEDLATAIEAAGVPAIFTEALGTDTDARALADRLGVAVVELTTDTLGEDGSETDTYAGMLRTTAQRIAGALGAAAAGD